MYMGASEIWVLCGRGLTKRVIPFYCIIDVLDISVVDVLPVIHVHDQSMLMFILFFVIAVANY